MLFRSAEIVFDTWHMVTKVYLDSILIYSWGVEYSNEGIMLGAARHHIVLPTDYNGKLLTIELTATENGAMPNITSVAYYSSGDAAIIWFNRPIVLGIAGIFYVIIGFAIVVISCMFMDKGKYNIEEIMIGACVMLTGIYILSRGK